ncbi:hypothetical protein PoB_002874400 [Plakobranchus ocellatus]|uniref:TIR domain-containing protein n=1 Tax=Plakobranchus ocellatus TaxID=259542 RepID=A0AAV4A3I7_9GAST|nr:hypothetical protein PoB_002874400 [Plakobranchus ocellatus]
MANVSSLKITRVIRVSHVKGWCAILFTLIIMILGPMKAVENYHFSAARQYGDITKKLLHDVEQAYQSPGPFLSSWLEHPIFIKDTTYYRNPVSDDLNNLEIYLMLFSWETFFMLCLKLMDDWFRTGDFIFEVTTAEFKAHWIKYLLFLSISSAYAFLLVFGTDGGFNIIYQFTRDNIVDWLEKSYVSIKPTDTGMSLFMRRQPHPLTEGLSNPFFLREEFRFVGEDVQFVCEYEVLGAQNVEPIYASSWWLKNGTPLKTDDRQLINVTVKADEDSVDILGMRWFIIRNTLTITMVESQHFGSYACIYLDPMPQKIIIKPVFETSKFWRETFSAPKSDHSECGCKPNEDTLGLTTGNIRECFAEFELKERAPKQSTVDVNVNIGGILNEGFTYLTLADPSDVSVDVTFLDSTSTKCCSPVSKLYWIFFKGGGFVDLPISRVIWSNETSDRLNVEKWMCVCKDTPRMHKDTIYRNIYNSTLIYWETVAIQYPVSLAISSLNNETPTFLESLQFCNKISSPYSLCGFLDLILENQRYTVYGFDIFILQSTALLSLLLTFLLYKSKSYVSIPLRKACTGSFTTLPIQFEAVNGPLLESVRNRATTGGDHDEVKNDPVYDVFLSYCNEDAYDRAVAQHFKAIAIDIGLTVFDPHEDILAGQIVFTATSAAIHRSSRFVILFSDAYKQDSISSMEFGAINDTIISQHTIAKSRLLVFRVGSCVVDGMHQVPCIPIPGSARGTYSLDESCLVEFKEWERGTRPDSTKVPARYKWLEWLRYCGFNWKSVVHIFTLFILIWHSTFFYSEEQRTSSYDSKHYET